MAIQDKSRLTALDSLRGLAAFVVLLAHCYLIYPEAAHARVPLWVSFTPIRLLYSSHAAVILFFVLSGYVLAIPFARGTQPRYAAYLLKRLFRIYLPFAGAILLAAVLFHFSRPTPAGLASDWLRSAWEGHALTPAALARHFAMTGMDNDMWLDGVMWSLVYELRVSLCFPLIVWAGRDLGRALGASALIYAASVAAMLAMGNHELFSVYDPVQTLVLTLRFACFFLIGATLALHHTSVMALLEKLPRAALAVMFLGALVVLTIPPEIHNQRLRVLLPFDDTWLKFVVEFASGIASALIIVCLRFRPRLAALMEIAPLRWIGKISYSLYLIHLPIAFFLFPLLLGRIAFGWIALLTIALSLIAAEIFYQLVERQSISLGKRFAGQIKSMY